MPSFALLRRLRGSLRSSAFERDMAAELEFHIALETDALMARGMGPAAAAAEARRRFGSVALARDGCRESWGLRALDDLRQDIRYALRVLARSPGYALVVLLTLALGIGATTAIFSVVHAVLLRSLPYANSESLIEIRQPAPAIGLDNIGFSASEIDDYRRHATSLDAVVEYHQMAFNLLSPGSVSRVVTGVVSPEFFDVIGVTPMLGRAFRAADDAPGASPVLILSYDYWRDALGSDPRIIGRTFEMNDRVHTVVGVLPPVTAYPERNDVYMPVSSCPFRSAPHMATDRRMRMVSAIGRMKPDVTLDAARRNLADVAHQFAADHPAVYDSIPGFTATAVGIRERLTSRARPTLLVLLAATGFVLLLVCANVANLTLARMAGRTHELSLRSAIGAGRARLARQLLTEQLLLAVGGGALGLVIAAMSRELLVAFVSRFTLRAAEISIDRTVLAFALVASIASGLLSGIIPALRTRTRPSRGRVGDALIAAQVAISFVLLIGAGLMVRSWIKLQSVDAGFDADHVVTARVYLDWVKYDSAAKRRAYFQTLLGTVEALTSVRHAAWSPTVPLEATNRWLASFLLEGDRADDEPGRPPRLADLRLVSPRYFQTLGMMLVSGRGFTIDDEATDEPVAIVNASMARHQFGGVDPAVVLGRRVSLNDGRTWATVVGLVNDVKQYGLDKIPSDEMYVPFAPRAPLSATLLVRTTADPAAMLRAIARAAQDVDPKQPLTHTQTLEQVRHGSLDPARVTTLLMSLFAFVAVVVTAAGIAGVVSFAVAQRTFEIGVRMALGASCASIARLIAKQGIAPVALGLLCGIAAAALFAPAVSRLLFDVGPTDAATYGTVAVTLVVVAALACVAPARRAGSVDPIRALRTE